jgi:hypothetical protein
VTVPLVRAALEKRKAGDPHPYVVGTDSIRRYVKVAKGKRREASTVIVLADFGIGWIAQLSLLTSAALNVGLCSASSMTRPPDVD